MAGQYYLDRPSYCQLKTDISRQKKSLILLNINNLNGGEGGIRTLDGRLTHTPLAGERLQPLGHLSVTTLNSKLVDQRQSSFSEPDPLGFVKNDIRITRQGSLNILLTPFSP